MSLIKEAFGPYLERLLKLTCKRARDINGRKYAVFRAPGTHIIYTLLTENGFGQYVLRLGKYVFIDCEALPKIKEEVTRLLDSQGGR